jgi:hypothetical protein
MTSAHPMTEEPPVATTDDQTAASPWIVRGHPSTVELAVLVAVLAGAAAGGGSESDDGSETGVAVWAARDRLVRSGLHPGPGRWRASALPR